MNQSEYHQKNITHFEVSTFEKVKRLLDFEYGSRLKILDVGCGNGALADELAKMGHQVVGLDVQVPSSTSNSWQFINADVNFVWPVEDKSFDLVICTDVAEHMYEPAHVLNEARRVLKDDGQLIFGVPNHFDLRQRLRILFGQGIVHWDAVKFNPSAWDYAHIRFFSIDDLENRFAKTGWHIVARQYNFMGAGIVPSWAPQFLRLFLLEAWPGLFSGKFVYLLSKTSVSSQPRLILVPKTKPGM